MNAEDDTDQHEWDRVRGEKKRELKRAAYLAAVGEPLPRIMQELYLNAGTRFEFFRPLYDKKGAVDFPFGGIIVQKHSRDDDLWRVYWHSPFEGKGVLPIKGSHGYLMSREQAFQFAREMQP